MPETLETIASRLVELGKSIDARFATIDQWFATIDQRFAEMGTHLEIKLTEVKTHLEMKIEAVGDRVKLVMFTQPLDDHEIRILALEPPESADR